MVGLIESGVTQSLRYFIVTMIDLVGELIHSPRDFSFVETIQLIIVVVLVALLDCCTY